MFRKSSFTSYINLDFLIKLNLEYAFIHCQDERVFMLQMSAEE